MKALKVLALFILLSLMGVSSLMTVGQPGNRSLELTVCPQGPPICDFARIQEAIDAAPEGTTIRIKEGTYVERLVIRKSLRLIGIGQERVFLKRVMPEQSPQEWLEPTLMIEGDRIIQVWIEGLSIVGPLSAVVKEPPIIIEGITMKGQMQVVLQKLTVSGHSFGISIIGDPQAILQEVTLSRNVGGILIAGRTMSAVQSLIRNSTITENEIGIAGSDFVLEGSTITKNQGFGISISPWLPQSATRILKSIIAENKSGIWVNSWWRPPPPPPWEPLPAGEPLVEIYLNRIVGNREYGVVIQTAECTGIRFESGPLRMTGGGNEMRDNQKGDLCPADYPWPPNFKKP